MDEPFITPEMEQEPGPRCDRCQSPGEFRAGRCSGCIAETQDREQAIAAAQEIIWLAGSVLTTQYLPDDQMRRLVKIRQAGYAIQRIL